MDTVPRTPTEGRLRGVRVLITRAARDGDALRERLEGLGASVSHLPAITVQPPEDLAPLDAALSQLERYRYLVFTSRNAVEAVFARPALQCSAWIPQSLRVVASGEATIEQLRQHRVQPVIRPSGQGAAGAAEAILRDNVHGKCILYPTSDLAEPVLTERLRAAGAVVDQIVAYRTSMPSDVDTGLLEELCDGRFDVVTVASPSAVRNLKAMLGPDWGALRRARLVCIGETTARGAREEGLEPQAVAAEPSAAGLVDAILSLYESEDTSDD